MPKTAIDPFFGTNVEPITAGRKGMVVTPAAADLPHVTSSLIVSATVASTVTVVMPDDLDGTTVTIPFPVGVTQLLIQVRAITAVTGGPTVIALWS